MTRTSLYLLSTLLLLAPACTPSSAPSETLDETESGTSASSSATASESSGESETSEGASSSETGEEMACDSSAHLDCYDQARELFDACTSECGPPNLSCGAASCHWQCDLDQQASRLGCDELHCPDPPHIIDYDSACVQEVAEEALACADGPSCDAQSCALSGFWASTDCACELPPFTIGYAGSCVLAQPYPEAEAGMDWTQWSVPGSGEILYVGENACGDVQLEAFWSLEGDVPVLSLCPAACAAFEQAGELKVEYRIPCE